MRVSTDRSDLEVVVQGEGEPILTIHGAFWGEAFGPLLDEPPLQDGFKRIRYWRHGYRESSKPDGNPYSVDDVVEDARDVLSGVGKESAHVVAHSLGGTYALQLARSYPEEVRTLTLMEPLIPSPEYAEWAGPISGQIQEAVGRGDVRSALDASLTEIHGDKDYRRVLDPALPSDWPEECEAQFIDQQTVEVTAVRQWSFGPDEAKDITCPVLLIRGEQSVPVFIAHHNYLLEWLPNVQEYIDQEAGHFELIAQPRECARELSDFLHRHPIETERQLADD
jgi:pimeloyl-ACP methyl ester carboxylesterase